MFAEIFRLYVVYRVLRLLLSKSYHGKMGQNYQQKFCAFLFPLSARLVSFWCIFFAMDSLLMQDQIEIEGATVLLKFLAYDMPYICQGSYSDSDENETKIFRFYWYINRSFCRKVPAGTAFLFGKVFNIISACTKVCGNCKRILLQILHTIQKFLWYKNLYWQMANYVF